jgi:hypothetical protein
LIQPFVEYVAEVEGRKKKMNVNAFLGLVTLLGVAQAPKSDRSSDPFVLIDVALDELTNSVVLTKEFVPPLSGTYWIELRYPMSLKQIDAKSPNKPRQLGQAIHESQGARLEATITEVKTRVLVPDKQKKWTPVEIATKTERVAADRLEVVLKDGVKYELKLKLLTPTKDWQKSKPRLVIEMSDALRNNHAASSLKAGLWLVGGAVVFSLLILCVCLLVRWVFVGRTGRQSNGEGSVQHCHEHV